MKYVRFKTGSKISYGIVEHDLVHEISPNYFVPFKRTGKKYKITKVKLCAPCQPTKIVALGLNYISHAAELKMPIPLSPLIFLKPPSAVIGPGEKIVYPYGVKRLDYEAELALVIKKRAKDVPIRKFGEYVLGYTCLNDVTARDLQRKDGQWTRAKSFDTFAPIGPCIVDGIDPHDLKIELFVNGRTKQSSNTRDLIFKIDEIVSFVSKVMTLEPGDIITTGTPPGVGPLKKGDQVAVKIEKIGVLKNKVS